MHWEFPRVETMATARKYHPGKRLRNVLVMISGESIERGKCSRYNTWTKMHASHLKGTYLVLVVVIAGSGHRDRHEGQKAKRQFCQGTHFY